VGKNYDYNQRSPKERKKTDAHLTDLLQGTKMSSGILKDWWVGHGL